MGWGGLGWGRVGRDEDSCDSSNRASRHGAGPCAPIQCQGQQYSPRPVRAEHTASRRRAPGGLWQHKPLPFPSPTPHGALTPLHLAAAWPVPVQSQRGVRAGAGLVLALSGLGTGSLHPEACGRSGCCCLTAVVSLLVTSVQSGAVRRSEPQSRMVYAGLRHGLRTPLR